MPRQLPGILRGSSGQTGADGRWTTRLAPGSYEVSYRLGGYVPYTSEVTEIREEGTPTRT